MDVITEIDYKSIKIRTEWDNSSGYNLKISATINSKNRRDVGLIKISLDQNIKETDSGLNTIVSEFKQKLLNTYKSVAYLDVIEVYEEYQNQGIATKALHLAEVFLSEINVEYIFLTPYPLGFKNEEKYERWVAWEVLIRFYSNRNYRIDGCWAGIDKVPIILLYGKELNQNWSKISDYSSIKDYRLEREVLIRG
jgi:GNAT superfamily N-acetyltransferase